MSEIFSGPAGRPPPAGAAAGVEPPEVLCTWTARRMRPVVLLGVLGVFAAFMLLAHFVFHSTEAVAALAMAAVAAVVPLVPAVRARVEYRLSDAALDSRLVTPDDSKRFKRLFEVGGLSHVVATRHGFMFRRPLNTTSPLRAFWRRYLSDAYSGEVHVESADRQRVLDAVSRLGVPVR